MSTTRLVNHTPNMTKKQLESIRTLKENKEIIIKPADKGSAVVVMSLDNYVLEAERQLANSRHYTPLAESIAPIAAIKISSVLNRIKRMGYISGKQLLYLDSPETPRNRQLDMLPKIHKTRDKWPQNDKMPPGRPIVSDCGSESYRVAEYIDEFLGPLATSHNSYVKDTTDFIEKVTKLTIPENAMCWTRLSAPWSPTRAPLRMSVGVARTHHLRWGETIVHNMTDAKREMASALHGAVDGCGLKASRAVSYVHEWVSNGTALLTGANFIHALQIRSATVSTKQRAARGRPEADRRCDACWRTESLGHVLQVCPRTWGHRIKRHDALLEKFLHRMENRGWSVTRAPVITVRGGRSRTRCCFHKALAGLSTRLSLRTTQTSTTPTRASA